MDIEKLKLVIKEFQERSLPQIVERRIVNVNLKAKKIISIFGPRRSGKTFYFYEIIGELISKGIEKTRILYMNFEDERIAPFDSGDFHTLLETYYEMHPENKGKEIFLFLDEVQNVKGWENAVRRINDNENMKIFITGSSSKLLSRDIATALRGRTISYEMLPFSFEEILLSKGIKPAKEISYSKERFRAKNLLGAYIKFGGFPEIVLEDDETTKIRILQEYLNVIFFRDLVERFSVKNTVLLKEMIRFLISNISNYFSLTGFYNVTKEKHGITKQTIIDYSSYLEDIDFLFFVSKYSSTLKEQMRNPRKIYIVDVGFRAASGFYVSEDYGRVAENIVFLKLKQLQLKNPLIEIFYWKNSDGKEVDFMIKQGKSVKKLVQASWNIKESEEREVSGLLAAMEEFNLKSGTIVTKDFEGKKSFGKKSIYFISLWKFLLSEV